jgi:hypothetical protein
MSPYAQELAHARLDALRELVDALNAAEDPAEKRRCAVAIFSAPDPSDIDDAIELDDDEEPDPLHTPGMSESSSESRGYPDTHAPKSSPCSSTASAPLAHEMGERISHDPLLSRLPTNPLDLLTPLNLPSPRQAPAQSLLARAGLPP